MSHTPTIVVVGSGPIGSAYARLLLEGLPDARVDHVRGGSAADRAIPGESVRNIADPAEKERAREMSQGPQAGAFRESLGIPPGVVVEGMFTARQGTHLLRLRRRGLGARADVRRRRPPRRTSAGRARTGPARPRRPAFSEKIPFIADDEWDDLHRRRRGAAARAERRVRRLRDRRRRSARCSRRSSATSCPRATAPSTLPVAGDPQPDGSMRWAGADCRPRSAHRAGQPARRALRAARSVARAPRRARGRPGHRRHRGGPAHPRDLLRARRISSSWPPTRSARRSCCGPPASVPPPSAAT